MSEIVTVIRRLTMRTLNRMYKDTECADFSDYVSEFAFSANEIAVKAGISAKKALQELRKLHKAKDVSVVGVPNGLPAQACWQLVDIEAVVANFALKHS